MLCYHFLKLLKILQAYKYIYEKKELPITTHPSM